MPNLYLVSALFYLVTAVLMALDIALVHWGVLPGFSGLAWLRVHFITLGFVSQAVFGVLPRLQAARYQSSRPRTRLDIWLALHLGLVVLIAGIPIVNKAMILTGGTLVFVRMEGHRQVDVLECGFVCADVVARVQGPGLAIDVGEQPGDGDARIDGR